MKPSFFLPVLAFFLISSCQKNLPAPTGDPSFTLYRIAQGRHYSDHNPTGRFESSGIKYTVIFDSSAIYQSADPENQEDINKLFGFSDNNLHHQQYSARIGWRWSGQALRLFAYVYNNGELITREISSVPLGTEISCSIKITGDTYTFQVGEHVVDMPRGSTTLIAEGYRLYPYFGGDEPAPHEVRIWLREESFLL